MMKILHIEVINLRKSHRFFHRKGEKIANVLSQTLSTDSMFSTHQKLRNRAGKTYKTIDKRMDLKCGYAKAYRTEQTLFT